MPPVIGITLCLDEQERWRKGRQYLYLDHAYALAVERAGAVAVQLPIQRNARRLLDRIDGLLLPGGDDLPPDAPYPAEVEFDLTPQRQIDFDRRLLGEALARHIPVLGICYGAQLLALHHGGRLHHHLPLDLPASQPHQLPEQAGRHALTTEPGSRLAQLLDESVAEVNSLHHQAVADPGSGMRVCARSPDGVIEAIEAVDERFAIGVQWHPEKLSGPGSERLFRALVAASAEG